MEDNQIVELYLARNEQAISESDKKYGTYCKYIAKNVLTLEEDAEECVNDTFLTAWNRIPPVIPECLKAFLGRISRDIAITKYRANHAQKRYAGVELMLSELEECLPAEKTVESELDMKELSRVINEWLSGLSETDRVLFVKRYFHGVSVKRLAFECGTNQNNMAQKFFSLRKSLKNTLDKEDIVV